MVGEQHVRAERGDLWCLETQGVAESRESSTSDPAPSTRHHDAADIDAETIDKFSVEE